MLSAASIQLLNQMTVSERNSRNFEMTEKLIYNENPSRKLKSQHNTYNTHFCLPSDLQANWTVKYNKTLRKFKNLLIAHFNYTDCCLLNWQDSCTQCLSPSGQTHFREYLFVLSVLMSFHWTYLSCFTGHWTWIELKTCHTCFSYLYTFQGWWWCCYGENPDLLNTLVLLRST